jgi:disulfide bond formation protein DsbB
MTSAGRPRQSITGGGLIGLAAVGSVLALAGALASQYGWGLAPCQLCIWQRWPHLAAVFIGVLALAAAPRAVSRRALVALALAGALAAAASGAIGAYHTGVERGWWQGPASCAAGGGIAEVSIESLLDPAVPMATPVPCSEAAAMLAGLSMASWNVIWSLGLAGLWLAAAVRLAEATFPERR